MQTGLVRVDTGNNTKRRGSFVRKRFWNCRRGNNIPIQEAKNRVNKEASKAKLNSNCSFNGGFLCLNFNGSFKDFDNWPLIIDWPLSTV